MVRKYYQDIANLEEKYTEKQRKYNITITDGAAWSIEF